MIEYKTVTADFTGFYEEKKSRFIATLHPVTTEEEALEFINKMKKQYWDARHNCSAYIIGADNPIERSSDDGEPSRTAGLPMLEVLKGAELRNVCLVVTRYFGGVLLGTGGLVRAYQSAAKDAVANTQVLTCRQMNRVVFTIDYTAYGKLQYIATGEGLTVENTDFSDSVNVTMLLDDSQLKSVTKKITEITSGSCTVDNLGKYWVLV